MKEEKESLKELLIENKEEKIKEYLNSNGKQKLIIPFIFENRIMEKRVDLDV